MNTCAGLGLLVSLCETYVWRRLVVSPVLTLKQLHDAIQCAMGWEDSHLFTFYRNRVELPESAIIAELFVRAGSSKLVYVYDFGDDWRHEVKLEKRLGEPLDVPLPTCVAGELTCPPEDCGGIYGYERLLTGRRAETDEELLEWWGDWKPDAFDLEAANARLWKKFGVGRTKTRTARPVAITKKAGPAEKGTPAPPNLFTQTQGQYLAFVFWYTRVNRRPPAQTDIATFFGVTGPAVAAMIGSLEKRGLLERGPGQARSLRVLVDEAALPALDEPSS